MRQIGWVVTQLKGINGPSATSVEVLHVSIATISALCTRSFYFNGSLSRVWLRKLWSGGNAVAFDFSFKKKKKQRVRALGSQDHLSQQKTTNGKPRFGKSKRGLTLAGALRWKRDNYRVGHWPRTTENFFFFSLSSFFFNLQALFHLEREIFFSCKC